MTSALELLSLGAAVALVVTICLLIHRIDAVLRSAERSVRAVVEQTASMRIHAGQVSPGIEAMNQNLYLVAVRLSQLGGAAEALNDPPQS